MTSSGRQKVGLALFRAQPWLLRRGEVIWRPLRRVAPALRIKTAVVFTRHEDVREVLERDDVFSVTYGEHMEAVTGPFILGWDDGERYRHEVGALHAAVRRADLPSVADLTRERAAEVVGAAGGAVDGVVLADEVVGAGLDRYFGLPELADGRHRAAARDVFRAVFFDADVPETVMRGKAGSALLVAAIGEAMDRERAAARRSDTVLGRLMAAGDLDDEAIPRNLVGLVAAWAASVPRAFALALDVLLDRSAEVQRISRAAADHDEAAIATLWLEALRMQPQAAFLARKARSAIVIAPGAPREVRLQAGDVAIVSTQSAMRDRHVLDDPDALRDDRPRDEMLHFGAGIHRCFGALIAEAQFGALGAVLLGDGTAHRAGSLTWGPAFPESLPVALGARPGQLTTPSAAPAPPSGRRGV